MLEPLEIPADLDTPVSAYLKLQDFKPLFLLESVEGGEVLGRYSFLGFGSDPPLPIDLDRIQDPFAHLRHLLLTLPRTSKEDGPRFTGGLVGFVGYDMVRKIERLPVRAREIFELPQACFLKPQVLLTFDHLHQRLRLAHRDGEAEAERVRRATKESLAWNRPNNQ